MTDIGIVGPALIVVNVVFSYQAFTNQLLFDQYKFEIDSILIHKDFKRLVTSGFLHVGWVHLIFNMLSLYAFSDFLELYLGKLNFLLLYFSSLIGGNLLALFVHRNHGDYSAVGASGAVSGVIFASIALFPDVEIGLLGIPLYFPGWLYGIVYIGYSIYGIKSNRDNIGHEAHLGGALVGMLTVVVLEPGVWAENYRTILLIAFPALLFIYLIATRPQMLLIGSQSFSARSGHYDIDHRYNEEKVNKEKELDKLLEKIKRKGMGSLTKKEKEDLEKYSK